MAVTKQDVLSFIAEHITDKRKNVPRKDIIAHLGDGAGAIIDELKKEGTIKGNRGRTGGLTVVGATTVAAVEDAPIVEAPAQEDDTAAQFAALLAKMEADEVQEQPVQEAAPF